MILIFLIFQSSLEFETPKLTAAEPTGRASMKEATKAEEDYAK